MEDPRIVQKMSHIDRSLERIANSLERMVKIMNRQVPPSTSDVEKAEERMANVALGYFDKEAYEGCSSIENR